MCYECVMLSGRHSVNCSHNRCRIRSNRQADRSMEVERRIRRITTPEYGDRLALGFAMLQQAED